MFQAAAQSAVDAGRVPMGSFVVLDPMARIVRITPAIYSFAAITYQRTRDGLRRVC
jgi:hypothetical protein